MPRIVPRADLPKLTSYIDTRRPPHPLAFHLMLYAGLRIGEVTKLAWDDLIHNAEPKTAIVLDKHMTKNHQQRTVPITKPLAASIKATWLNFGIPNNFGPANYAIAITPASHPVTTRTLQRHLHTIGKNALGYHVNPHMLRHTFATELLAVTNLVTVQQALGHRRISTTAIYTHPSTDVVSEGMNRMYRT